MTLFSTYASLEKKTNEEGVKAINYTLLLATIVYMSTAIPCVFMFGSAVDRNVFANISSEQVSWDSVILRLEYIVVISCHIPYFVFSCKECLLAVVDEFHRSIFSKTLMHKLESKQL